MRVRWDPNVRTRHLVAIITLALGSVALLTGFSVSRLLGVEVAAKHRAQESLANSLFLIAQRVISERPGTEALTVISKDTTVRELLSTYTGPNREFAYTALVKVDGTPIIEFGERANTPPVPLETLENAFWPSQLWRLWLNRSSYELRSELKLNNQPFAQIIARVSGPDIRREIQAPILLILIFAASLAGVALLVALLSSPFVLRPLRDVFASIEQLEAEAVAQGEPAVANIEAGEHPHNITQRLRILGRRFAGNRSELEMTRDQLRQVIGGLSERVILLDREQRVLLASPEAERLLGGSGSLTRGRVLAEALGPAHPLATLTARAYAAGQSQQIVTALAANGGEPQKVAAAVQLFKDRSVTAGALVALRDFAALERLETQLDFATRLAALNRIMAGVAHEVKNPLHAMVLHLELLKAKLNANANPQTHVEILVSEVHRLNRVVQTFLDFNRPVELRPQLVEATMILREVLLLAADVRTQNVELRERYAEEPLIIKVDADLFKQALLNIVINGCQAMPDGGALQVETERAPDGHVWISIRDEGPGIRPEIREKIFNLYFTTKPQGNGIGLAQAYRAVQLHNGRIEVESEPGAGACFKIILPAG
jgi:signal transduction histidine kinase